MFHDTYFVVGHFHTVLSMATVIGILLGLDVIHTHLFGRSNMDACIMLFISLLLSGAALIFGPMHSGGPSGMIRRVPQQPDVFLPSHHLS